MHPADFLVSLFFLRALVRRDKKYYMIFILFQDTLCSRKGSTVDWHQVSPIDSSVQHKRLIILYVGMKA
jgi:hypothetical protein